MSDRSHDDAPGPYVTDADERVEAARALVDALRRAVGAAAKHLADQCRGDDRRVDVAALDQHQVVAYDLAQIASAVSAGQRLVEVADDEHGAAVALGFAADACADLLARAGGREAAWGLEPDLLRPHQGAIEAGRSPELLAELSARVLSTGEAAPRHLDEELELVRLTFRRFARDVVEPVAERVHRDDLDLPEEVITGLAELGGFGLSIPERYGGFAAGGEDDLVSMVLVTEELSRASLGVAGSLITRPEIMAAAVLAGGTEEQKQRWLPPLASGERMCAVAVTEPDHGSDVAGISLTATRDGDDWVLNGGKTWCTFAGRAQQLLVLARTGSDRSLGHRGLSLFVVDKPVFAGREWSAEQNSGGSMEARAIATIGYRGMHSFEISFDGWRVPHADLIGGDDGLGRGFYLQLHAFANGRLQTAARAQGVMQAALEQAANYTQARRVFGAPLADHGLTQAKLGRMALLLAACRAFSLTVARQLARGESGAQLAASQAKLLACRASEWVTREAQQLHGGYGYAEEYMVSRLFVDARVLSIFEGADEVLALKVVARQLVEDAEVTP